MSPERVPRKTGQPSERAWLTPDEVLSELRAWGIPMGRTTLQRYTRNGLVPEPERGSHGRGKGRFTYYPPETVFEAVASAHLVRQGCSLAATAAIRAVAVRPYDLAPLFRRWGEDPPSKTEPHELVEKAERMGDAALLPGPLVALVKGSRLDGLPYNSDDTGFWLAIWLLTRYDARMRGGGWPKLVAALFRSPDGLYRFDLRPR